MSVSRLKVISATFGTGLIPRVRLKVSKTNLSGDGMNLVSITFKADQSDIFTPSCGSNSELPFVQGVTQDSCHSSVAVAFFRPREASRDVLCSSFNAKINTLSSDVTAALAASTLFSLAAASVYKIASEFLKCLLLCFLKAAYSSHFDF